MDFFQRIASLFMAFIMSIAAFFGIHTETPQPEPAPIVEEEEQGTWLLQIPQYDGGYYSLGLYNTGLGLHNDFPGYEETDFEENDLSETFSSDPGMMQIVRKTNLNDVAAYRQKLEAAGYSETFENQIENNFYYGYESENSSVYFYFNGNTAETRIIDDRSNTTSLSTFSYHTDEIAYAADEPLHPTVYQFSYPYLDAEHVGKDHYGSNGMLYTILLSDGKVIVIDGGNRMQSSEQNISEFWRFLQLITGKGEEDTIDIALWFGTHSHGDHNGFFYKFLRRHSDHVNLERAMFNFTAEEVFEKNDYSTRIRSILATRYPQVQYIKARSGYRFQLQDADCQILYSHEDSVRAKDVTWSAASINDCCLVMKVTIGQNTFLITGDADLATQEILLRHFSAQTLSCNVLQAAHHGLNALTDLYQIVQPSYVMYPASKLRVQSTPYASYEMLRTIVPEDHFFFANQNIVYGFTPQNDGSITVSEIPVECGAHDGSTLH